MANDIALSRLHTNTPTSFLDRSFMFLLVVTSVNCAAWSFETGSMQTGCGCRNSTLLSWGLSIVTNSDHARRVRVAHIEDPQMLVCIVDSDIYVINLAA